MAKEELEIVITAKDETKGKISGLQTALGGLGKFAAGAAVAGLAAVAGGTAIMGDALGTAMGEAIEAEENMAQLDTVIKSTGGAAGVTSEMATGLADSLSSVTRFSDDTIIKGESMLLTFTNIGKDIFPEATLAALDMSQAMGQDMQTSAIQLGKALNDPIAGVGALQRVGVTFSDSQKDTIKALVDSGKSMEAQKIILAELMKEFGGSAKAAGETFGGQMDILKNNLLNAAEAVGTALLPQIKLLASDVLKFVQSDQFLAWVEKAVQWLRNDLPIAVAKAADFWRNDLQPALRDMWPILRDQILPAFAKIVEILGVILPPIMSLFAKGWQLQIGIFNFFMTPINTVIDAFNRLRDMFERIMTPGSLFMDLVTKIRDVLATLKLPDFLKPGSPTPLELGLVGITNAMKQLNGVGLPALGGGLAVAGAAPAGGAAPRMAGGAVTVIVNLNAPVVGFADKYALGAELGPIIKQYLEARR